jgi:hypothetical protein
MSVLDMSIFFPDMSLPSMSINVSPMCPDHDMSNACYVVPRKQIFPDVYSAPYLTRANVDNNNR